MNETPLTQDKANAPVGTLPSEIGLLTNLHTLNLDSACLTGTVPQTLSALTKLVSLSLPGSSPYAFRGDFNARGKPTSGPMPSVAAMTELKTLSVGNSNFSAPMPWQFPSSLTELNLGYDKHQSVVSLCGHAPLNTPMIHSSQLH
jgi:hypothetical protein